MTIPTRLLVISTEAAMGVALPNARVRFVLSAPDSDSSSGDGKAIVPSDIWADLDGGGNGSVSLWPNPRGTRGTFYRVTVFDQYNRVKLAAQAVMPDVEATPFLTALQLAPAPPLDAAQLAVQQAQAAATAAAASAAQAALYAGAGGFVWNQNTPAATWVVTHPLGKLPSVVVEDSAGDEVEGAITYDSTSQLRIFFSSPFSGRAILN